VRATQDVAPLAVLAEQAAGGARGRRRTRINKNRKGEEMKYIKEDLDTKKK
jgi:hypothetical protein